MKTLPNLRIAFVALACLLLAACGGGGGGDGAAAAPPAAVPRVTLSASPAAIALGQSVTLTWSASNAGRCEASGDWSGVLPALSGTQSVTPLATGVFNYVVTCDGVAADAAVAVQAGSVAPPANGDGSLISVVVCFPGTSLCRTIERMRVETASSGVRILAAALDPAIVLPAVTNDAALPVGACAKRSGGFLWGALRQADVAIAGQVASGLSIQVIGDAGAPYAAIPADCGNAGANLGTVTAIEANGIVGLGPTATDCGAACAAQVIPGTYYACGATGCVGTVLPVARQVANPAAFVAAGG